MRVSDAGRAFITKEEGLKLQAYLDSVGIWTIGVGHTAAAGPPAPKKGMKITAEEADDILERDLRDVEETLEATVRVDLTQNQVDACASLILNIGGGAWRKSSVLRKINQRDFAGAADAFLLWKNAGGKPILLKRRQRERALFLKRAATQTYGLISRADEEDVAVTDIASAATVDQVREVVANPHVTAKDLKPVSSIVRTADLSEKATGVTAAVAAPAGIVGWFLDRYTDARDTLQPIFDTFEAIPGIVYFVVIIALLGLWYAQSRFIKERRVAMERDGSSLVLATAQAHE